MVDHGTTGTQKTGQNRALPLIPSPDHYSESGSYARCFSISSRFVCDGRAKLCLANHRVLLAMTLPICEITISNVEHRARFTDQAIWAFHSRPRHPARTSS